ncbi:kynureninase [Arthrobacter sp. MYb224]|uniref:kynureninase n=1 Tax=Arthrobacter sp. MYb224 TaxID=1848600 RepID=UPI000CFBF953|nr:kynureninase [Arthrobacter sp. MYb224]PQZ98830.1 kynureninase [Arthrobacter sp. MYb224]
MSTVVSREKLELLDRQDALASFKDRFLLPDGVLYLDGNSLGPLPAGAAERAAEVVNVEWGQGLIRSWNSAGWFEMPTRLGDKLGSLLGANPGETVVTDTTSLNLFKALASALRIQQVDGPGRRVIITERDNFPTDIYIAEGLAELLNSVGAETGIRYEVKLIDNETELRAALGEDTAVLSLSHVNYRTGSMWDMAGITEAVHEAGGLAIWDLAHAAGAVPVDLNAAKADYAVGCTYKYLNGGPGSPAFIWVNARHQDRFWQPLTGWWSHQAPFEMAEQYTPANDVRRFMCGTQPVTSMAMIEVGLDIAVEAEMELVRAKSLELTDLFIELVETRCAGHGLELITPREHGQRGSHVSFHHPNGYEIIAALIERGVIGDYREPAVLRFGITPLYLSRTDIWDAVEILREVLHTGHWQREEFAVRNAVT